MKSRKYQHSVRRNRASSAFTIVELLIVVVIIAILATITVVAYNGLQQRARASAASSAVSQAKKKLELYKVDNSTYPATGNLSAAGITDSNDTTYQYTATNNNTNFCLTATNVTVSYYINDTTASSPTAGGCPGHGQGGGVAVTNLAYNPSGVMNVAGWSAWAGSSGGIISISSVDAPWATRARAVHSAWTVTNTAYDGDLGWQVPSTTYNLSPNTQYTASWRVRTSKAQRLKPYAGNWGILGGGQGSGTGTTNASSGTINTTALAPTTQWITFTTGANTIFCKIFSTATSGTGASYWNSGDYIEISDFMLVQGSAQYTFADGNSPNWVWNGTANASSSTGPAL